MGLLKSMKSECKRILTPEILESSAYIIVAISIVVIFLLCIAFNPMKSFEEAILSFPTFPAVFSVALSFAAARIATDFFIVWDSYRRRNSCKSEEKENNLCRMKSHRNLLSFEIGITLGLYLSYWAIVNEFQDTYKKVQGSAIGLAEGCSKHYPNKCFELKDVLEHKFILTDPAPENWIFCLPLIIPAVITIGVALFKIWIERKESEEVTTPASPAKPEGA